MPLATNIWLGVSSVYWLVGFINIFNFVSPIYVIIIIYASIILQNYTEHAMSMCRVRI